MKNPTIIYTLIRSAAMVVTALGLANFSEADAEQIVAAAASVFAAVDLIVKAFQAKRGTL